MTVWCYWHTTVHAGSRLPRHHNYLLNISKSELASSSCHFLPTLNFLSSRASSHSCPFLQPCYSEYAHLFLHLSLPSSYPLPCLWCSPSLCSHLTPYSAHGQVQSAGHVQSNALCYGLFRRPLPVLSLTSTAKPFPLTIPWSDHIVSSETACDKDYRVHRITSGSKQSPLWY